MKPSDIEFAEHALLDGSPGRVRVRWLGTAGFALEHDGWVVLIDPYLTRASLGRCLTGALRPDLGVIRRHTGRVDAIVCSHTHFDHVLDVPAIAKMTGARVFGSRSAVNLCRAADVREQQITDVESARGPSPIRAEVGPFELSFVPSAHSPLLAGRVPLPGDIADCDELPLRVERYRCGAVFSTLVRVAGRTVYHAGSANLDDDHRPPASHVDLLLLCAAGWTTTDRYVGRMLRGLSAGAIALSHWDNFFRPIDQPVRALPAIALPRLVEELDRESRGVRIGTQPLLGDLWL